MTSPSKDSYPLHRAGEKGVPASASFPKIEEDVLAYWKEDKTFKASLEQRPTGENGDNEFVFYDGPPFANGLPHYGHLLTGYAKDVVPRYKTMRGKRVDRRFGWDTHGLPAELEAERILGITDKSQIEEMGIEAFNEACRTSVLKYTKEWEQYVTRQARWVDFENDYKTLDTTFMESVIWAFKELYNKDLAYEGYRVLPYCWRDETPLSNHELGMDDDVYQSRQDPALTVGLRLETGQLVLIWTTTPWTLPANLAIAVGPDLEYVEVIPSAGSAYSGERIIIGKSRLANYAKELGEEPTVVATYLGKELAGKKYHPPFDYFYQEADNPTAHQILVADFVTDDNGTGLVHLAPAFGEDDMFACQEVGIKPVVTVDDKGCFIDLVSQYAGQQVFDANPNVIRDLKDGSGPISALSELNKPKVIRHETYQHSYPHCWRCRNPLIYKAVSSWFVKVTEIRDRMVELNQNIEWTPEHIKDGQFGKWLSGARDWSISRNRYFGTPIPVWKSDDPNYPRVDVYGSLAELEADFGTLPRNAKGEPDLHRPFIDNLTRPNPDDPTGKSTMRRISDVLDVWFDSGSMPFAQVHYPFENAQWFEHHYPGDFIVEYIGQTRGWFYTLHVLATALFDRPAFRHAVSHGIVLGSDGRKMSKSLRNYPDVSEVLDRDGSDAMRWFLMASPILRGGNLIVTEEGIREATRQVLLPIWSTYYFFTLYAGAANDRQGYQAKRVEAKELGSYPVMDRYILSRVSQLVNDVQTKMDAYDISGSCESIREFLDALTNWYVRTQRDRFWEEDTQAFDTLWTVLEILTRLAAPLLPLISEEVWRGLTGGRSVHLGYWPGDDQEIAGLLQVDNELLESIEKVRQAVSTSLGLRKANKMRVRQPLACLRLVVQNSKRFEAYRELLAGELNVREVNLEELVDNSAQDYGISQNLNLNARALGPRIGKEVQHAIKAAKSGNWRSDESGVFVQLPDRELQLVAGEYELKTVTDDSISNTERALGLLPGGGFVILDLALNQDLVAEGKARDLIRDIQEARKQANLEITDRIKLELTLVAQDLEYIQAYQEMIATDTLATEVKLLTSLSGEVKINLSKAN